jgi:parallel beta-helix repeat protein
MQLLRKGGGFVRRFIAGIMTVIIILSIFALTFETRPVRANGTIYIRADGSIDPPDAPIQRNGDLYTLTGDIVSYVDGIVIERSNITIDGDGYTLQGIGTGEGTGLCWNGINNVTVKNISIHGFGYGGIGIIESCGNTISGNNITNNMLPDWAGDGIDFIDSSGNIISENNITNNCYGIALTGGSNNIISGNNITNQSFFIGIFLEGSSNTVTGNNITNNTNAIYLAHSSNNTVSGNNIANNGIGTCLFNASDFIFHNNFMNNTSQVQVYLEGSGSYWDYGYPSGGNYWSDYIGTDSNGDGIGDTPYIIDESNQDRYPLMGHWPPRSGDLNFDGVVNYKDASLFRGYYIAG